MSVCWFGSMRSPFVIGDSTSRVDPVRIFVRIWHRVPEWKGGVHAAGGAGRPAPFHDPQHITDVALRLFADRGFAEVSVDDVAQAAGIARRTVFRYYGSKNAIPWGDFDAHLQHLRELLEHVDPGMSLGEALRAALLSFNTFHDQRPSGTGSESG